VTSGFKVSVNSSVVVICYQGIGFVKPTVEALLAHTHDFELILIDNHSPHQETRDYIKSVPGAIIVDKGCNLGSADGCNAGFEAAKGDYLFRFDDDTVVLTPNWNTIMIDAMQKNVAYLSINHNWKFPVAEDKKTTIDNLQIWESPINFPGIMVPRTTYELFGPLPAGFLYGTEAESIYYQKAVKHNMVVGVVLNALADYIGKTDDVDYTLWKVRYGAMKNRDVTYDEIIGDPQKLYENAELVTHSDWPAFVELATTRMKELLKPR